MFSEQIQNEFQIRRLGKEDVITSFDCGDEDLNDFILNESRHYRQARLAVSYVIEHRDTKQVVGFFSLANDRVSISDFESKTEFNKFRRKRLVNEKRIKSYPQSRYAVLQLTYLPRECHWGRSYSISSNPILLLTTKPVVAS